MTYAVTISGNNISFSMAAVEYSVSLSQSGLQGNKGDKGDKGDTGALLNNITGAYLGDAINTQPLFKEASLYADFRNQVYARGDRSGLTVVDTFNNLFDFSRASIGYATPASGTLTEYAVDVPRFDHDPLTGARKGLLIEPAQTNLLTYSSGFDNAAWSKSNVTVTADSIVAPDGTLTADTLTDNAVLSTHQANTVISVTAGLTYTLSAFQKAGSYETGRLALGGASMSFEAEMYDLSAGTVLDGNGTITALSNNWFRNTLSSVATATGNGVFSAGMISPVGTNYAGTGETLHQWGAQLVTGPYAGSYIPTGATTATRAADLVEVKPAVVADVLSADAGTVLIEATLFDTGASQVFADFLIAGSGLRDRIQLGAIFPTGLIQVTGVGGGVVGDPAIPGVITWGVPFRLVFTWGSRLAACLNGGAVDTSTTTVKPATIDVVEFGRSPSGGSRTAGQFARIVSVQREFLDAELQAITS